MSNSPMNFLGLALGAAGALSGRRNKLIKGDSYTDKVLTQAIYNVNKDKQR